MSGKRGDSKSALKSLVIIMFLCVARNSDRVSKKYVGYSALGRL